MHTDMIIRDPSCSKWASSTAYASSPMGQTHWDTSPMLSSTASDDYDDEFEQPQLTSDCRRRPHSPVPPLSTTISQRTPPHVAIPFPADNNTITKRHDVPPIVNSASSFRPPSPAPRFNGFTNSPLESPLSNSSPDHHVAINNDNTRLRTITVYNGLPKNLPPPPRPIAQRSTHPKPTTSQPSFNFMRDNYLTMLAQKSTDTVAPSDMHSALADIDRLTASPEWQTLGDAFPSFDSPADGDDAPVIGDVSDWVNEPLFGGDSPFLTSPHEELYDDFGTSPMDTPLSTFIATPTLGDMELESPLITDMSPLIAGFGDDMDLFGAASAFPTLVYDTTAKAAPKLPATDKLWSFSPSTPSLDSIAPASTTKTGAVVPSAPATRRRSNVTGTRKNLRPEALIPLDAPTQKRTYITPSATSRKPVPDAIIKKRLHSVAFGADDAQDEADLAALGELSPTASEAEIIEYKRRQNTLAARKSRKRKLEHQQALEDEVEVLKGEVTMWRERALMAQELLRGNGVNFSFDGQQA
ncbi:hypothetical protein B0H19DRAFT_1059112 [Mycena capillaripes]|nr:hypothetical protein B0H19DRAFT_1059112 [Mycena capillaripes]